MSLFLFNNNNLNILKANLLKFQQNLVSVKMLLFYLLLFLILFHNIFLTNTFHKDYFILKKIIYSEKLILIYQSHYLQLHLKYQTFLQLTSHKIQFPFKIFPFFKFIILISFQDYVFVLFVFIVIFKLMIYFFHLFLIIIIRLIHDF